MAVEATTVDEVRRSVRTSLARDLHDGPVRDLTDCVVQLEGFRKASAAPAMQEAITEVADRARSALDSLRRLMADLREETPEERFPAAVREMLEHYTRSFPTRFVLVISPTWPALLPRHVAVGLLRILEEAAGNAIRHAAAREVVVELQASSDELRIDVNDDGRGITESAQMFPGGGIVGMRERAAVLGGRFVLRRRPRGTHVRVSLPRQVVRTG